jgi:hypothetical protein
VGAPRIVVEDATGELLATTGEVTFGVRTGSSVVLDDPIAAAQHCAFAHDGRFVVRDLGSVSGTWLDGERVTAPTELRDGGQVVFGASRAIAKIEDRDGTPTLVLQLQRNGFWWRKAGKKVFDNDPDALVRAEVEFGRFPALRVGNRVAMIAAAVLLLGGVFVAALVERLADAGPLIATHATVTSRAPVAGAHASFERCRALANQQGCNVCHTTGAGVVEAKCVQCHGDMKDAATRRHPYSVDGELGTSTGMNVQQLCVLCHVDHVGADGRWLKPASAELVGKCEKCHGQTQRADNLPRLPAPPKRQRAFATYVFPHRAHEDVDCSLCHTIDPGVRARRDAGFPDDPAHEDFATVPFATCASCHVDGAPPRGITNEQQASLRAKKAEHRWTVTWHGSDDGGSHCRACHAPAERGGQRVVGPEMQTVARPAQTAGEYARERALYVVPTRTHAPEFEAHANGAQCTECHQNGAIAPAAAAPRAFWHALHVAGDSLAPAADRRDRVSRDETSGCASCHRDMFAAKALFDASRVVYHWLDDAQAQAACTATCHALDKKPLPPHATTTTIAPERRAAGPDFPHDVHLASKSPVLADGCFACHTFERAEGSRAFEFVPRTKDGAKDCSQCHTGHDNVGGGQCRVCHPAASGRSNSFLVAARVAPGTLVRGQPAPAEPVRDWPELNAFSHLSAGHAPEKCTTCHDAAKTGAADTLAVVPVPDEAVAACRACHVRRQFHWR